MQLKPIAAIAVVVLVGALVSVAGWATTTANQTPSASATSSEAIPLNPQGVVIHDPVLETFLAGVKNQTYANKNLIVKAWNLTWINSTSARLAYTVFNKSINRTQGIDDTYIKFPTTQAATNYVNSWPKDFVSFGMVRYGSIVKVPTAWVTKPSIPTSPQPIEIKGGLPIYPTQK